MKYSLAIFDLDGTILDTLEDLTDSLNHALAACGYPKRSLDEVRRFVGNGLRKLMDRAVPYGTAKEDVNRVLTAFTEQYRIHCADKTKPYDGIEDLLKALRKAGCKTAVVSNKADFAVQELCRRYFPGLFDLTIGERVGIQRKPAPDSVNEVIRRLSEERAKTIYIGDSEVDIQTAANAGLDSILVTWGFRDRALLATHGATRFAETPNDIARIVLEEP